MGTTPKHTVRIQDCFSATGRVRLPQFSNLKKSFFLKSTTEIFSQCINQTADLQAMLPVVLVQESINRCPVLWSEEFKNL